MRLCLKKRKQNPRSTEKRNRSYFPFILSCVVSVVIGNNFAPPWDVISRLWCLGYPGGKTVSRERTMT